MRGNIKLRERAMQRSEDSPGRKLWIGFFPKVWILWSSWV